VVSNYTKICELEKMLKEAVALCFKVLHPLLVVGSEKDT
jgi:hypothetical protein